MRKATRERGVGLYIHYSGVWDSRAIAEHPDWARIDEKGNRDPNNTSVFGPYIDELFVPQLKEVTAAYDLDGLWVDGECWAAQLDYSPRALAAWKKETSPLPRLDGDALGPDGLDSSPTSSRQSGRSRSRWSVRQGQTGLTGLIVGGVVSRNKFQEWILSPTFRTNEG